MVLDKLSESLKTTLKKIASALFIDEKLMDEIVKDIQRALLHADVNVQLVFEISKTIKKRALEEKPPRNISQKEYIIKIVYESLVQFLGKEKKGIIIEKKKPFKIMMIGLFGSGKTTSIGKIAKYYAKRGFKVAALGLDIHRPAALEQLEQVCKQIPIPVFIKKEKDPVKIYKEFEKEYAKYDILLIDTAGRDALSKDLIEEIKKLNKTIQPDERLLVLSADIGQAAQKQATSFHEAVAITGVLITKLDGTAKAGGAISACSITKAPIKFIGVGEKIDDLEEFDPERFVSRLLGMGDLKTLLEKAEEAIDADKAEDLGKRFLKGDFNFLDLYEQLQAMQKMGPLSKVMDLIPGMGNVEIPKEMINVQEGKLKKWKHILSSMTKEELEDPEILTRTRIERVAKGSGSSIAEVRELIKQYKQAKKLAKVMKGAETGDINKLMKKFKGKFPGMR